MNKIALDRLLTQGIAIPIYSDPVDAVRYMGAMQAQDYNQALWAIGLRTKNATVASVEAAIASGKIIRTWPMRGTLHFIAPEDVKWMLNLMASRLLKVDARRQANLELNEKILARCGEILHKALQGGNRLTRAAAFQLLEDAGVSTKSQRGYHILWHLSQSGMLCIGPHDGKQPTFVLLDEWVPHAKSLSREEALAELGARYFGSHGPATVYDLAWWAGITVTDAKLAVELAKPALLSEVVNGQEYWFAVPATRVVHSPSVSLLPGFDEYILGYKDRSAALALEHGPKIVPGGNGMFLATVTVDGQIVATWKRSVKKAGITFAINPFDGLTIPEAELTEAKQKYAQFLGADIA